MPASGARPTEPIPPRSDRAALVQAWVQALRTQARPAQLQALAPLSDAEAARVMALLRIAWTYRTDDGAHWQTPAPTSILNARPGPVQDLFDTGGPVVRMQRNLGAEADAMDRVWDLGLIPVDANKLQWRHRAAAATLGPVWTLAQEAHFGDFWAEQIPQLRAEGWSVVVQPGFAHESVPVLRWKLLIAPDTGELLGKEVDGPLAAREGAWMLSLGLEIDGETLDLAPMLADLLRRDARWLNAQQMAAIDDIAIISLRAPGGKRIDAPAGPLKAIVGAMVDLLTDPTRNQRKDGDPLHLGAWEAPRIQELRPYQLEGLAWLQYLRAQGLGGILADDMGLGKTAQALAHVLAEKEAGRLTRPALVVLPTSLLFNWQA